MAIRLASGHSVRIDSGARLRLLETGDLALDRGAVYVDSGGESRAVEPLSVHTLLGVVRESGTQYEVLVGDDSLRVRVREGSVVLSTEARTYDVATGTELDVDEDGRSTTRAISPDGPEWGWVASVTPVIDLQGMRVRAFLEWVARERGWSLAFATPAVERAAAEIVLGGTVDGLALDQMLDAVLPTCRMVHRLEGGVLTVDGLPEDGGAP
jgi:ferric-dicitrate binding protein FerR (iron transport regulator)